MSTLYEKRIYGNEAQYVPVNQPQPGELYYLRRIDEQNREYYTETRATDFSSSSMPQPPPYHTPTYENPNVPLLGMPTTGRVMAPQMLSRVAILDLKQLNLGLNITGCFIPILGAIGVGLTYSRLRQFRHDLDRSNSTMSQNLLAFMVLYYLFFGFSVFSSIGLSVSRTCVNSYENNCFPTFFSFIWTLVSTGSLMQIWLMVYTILFDTAMSSLLAMSI